MAGAKHGVRVYTSCLIETPQKIAIAMVFLWLKNGWLLRQKRSDRHSPRSPGRDVSPLHGCCATRPKLLRNFWDSNSAPVCRTSRKPRAAGKRQSAALTDAGRSACRTFERQIQLPAPRYPTGRIRGISASGRRPESGTPCETVEARDGRYEPTWTYPRRVSRGATALRPAGCQSNSGLTYRAVL